MKKKLLTALLIGTLAITGCGSDKKQQVMKQRQN